MILIWFQVPLVPLFEDLSYKYQEQNPLLLEAITYRR